MSTQPVAARYKVTRTGTRWGIRKDGVLIVTGLRNREAARSELRRLNGTAPLPDRYLNR